MVVFFLGVFFCSICLTTLLQVDRAKFGSYI